MEEEVALLKLKQVFEFFLVGDIALYLALEGEGDGVLVVHASEDCQFLLDD
jgi:hypothetical protein